MGRPRRLLNRLEGLLQDFIARLNCLRRGIGETCLVVEVGLQLLVDRLVDLPKLVIRRESQGPGTLREGLDDRGIDRITLLEELRIVPDVGPAARATRTAEDLLDTVVLVRDELQPLPDGSLLVHLGKPHARPGCRGAPLAVLPLGEEGDANGEVHLSLVRLLVFGHQTRGGVMHRQLAHGEKATLPGQVKWCTLDLAVDVVDEEMLVDGGVDPLKTGTRLGRVDEEFLARFIKILAAELAQRGIVGSKDVIEGRYGLFRTYVRDAAPDWRALLDGLGHEFPLLDKHGFKVWPACGYTRATNTAVLELRNAFNIRPDDVEAITVIGGTGGAQLLSEPLDAKRRPQLAIDGKFSIPFTTAVMMIHGTVRLRDYTEAALHDPAVLAMADRVSWRADPGAAVPVGGESALSRPTVEIRLRDGRTLARRADGVPGDPRHPVSPAQLEAKFRDCVSFAAKPVAAAKVDRAIALIGDLENLDDAAEIVHVLC